MSEKHKHKIESAANTHENLARHDHVELPKNQHDNKAEQLKARHEKSLEEIRREVEANAFSSELLKKDEIKDFEREVSQIQVQKELKGITLKKTMSGIQKQLPATDRAFSKVVHNPVVNKISDISEKTIARPIGILGGGALALLGSLLSTYFSRKFGMSYNIFMFVIFFAVGYILATLLELLYRATSKSRIDS